ncbi:hypothetical protein BBJ28_00019562 [Nothophytophthora sp. Chile5]|nr:hypothetical protein BBJ28_00019562 [Nothophytophthora sp. Chile5]
MRATIATYENSSCSQPASTLTYTNSVDCKPQEDHWNPVCEDDGLVYSVSDCTHYYQGGWDSYSIYDESFGWNPSLLVETYDTTVGWCGDDTALGDITVYHLDENCHSNWVGTASSKLTLGHSLTLSMYNDADCTTLATETTVSYAMATGYHQCVGNNTKYYLGGPTPPMTAVAVYEDDICSEAPVKLRFTQGFVCSAQQDPEKSMCQADGNAHYSFSNCASNYSEVAAATFGNNTPYLIMEEFDNYWCGQAANVTVFKADGSCHTNSDDVTSFRVTLEPDSTATITTYGDTFCNSVNNSTDVDKQTLMSYSCVGVSGCGSNYGCSQRFSIGGLGGPPAMGRMKSVALYGNSSCSQPAEMLTLSSGLTCIPQADRWNPVCAEDGLVYSVSDCIDYPYSDSWQMYDLTNQVFGWQQPYLTIETYDTSVGWCGDRDALNNITVYPLDGDCHVNRAGTGSTKLTMGHSLKITTFADAHCTATEMKNETTVSYAVATGYHPCVSNNTRYYLGGPTPPMTAVSIFDDSSCSEAPVKLEFTQDFVCPAQLDPTKSTCQAVGSGHYSLSNCTSNYFPLAATMFGNDIPYLVMEDFADPWCSQVANVTVFKADGSCHINTDDTTSFKVTINANKTATITTYDDPGCSSIHNSTHADKRMLTSYPCVSGYGWSQRFSIGGLGGPPSLGRMKAVAPYDNSSCSQPAGTVSFDRELTCTPQAKSWNLVCEDDGTVYSVSDCVNYYSVGWEASNFLYTAFGWRPFVIVETYDTTMGWCGDQSVLGDVTAYLLDENCHSNGAGTTSSKLTLDHSLTLSTYNDADCTALVTETTVSFGTASGYHQCVGNNTRYYLGGPTPPMTAVAVYEDDTCSKAPVKLQFTQGFACAADLNSTISTCKADGSALYSLSNCTSDYSGVAASTFGSSTPYLIMEEFFDWCGRVVNVTVYKADGSCHANPDDVTSFRVTLEPDSTATITTYDDTYCSSINNSTDVDRYTLMYKNCVWSNDCGNSEGYGCSKRYSLGGLDGTTSMNRNLVVAVYDESSCDAVPVQVVVTNQLVCTPPSAPVCDKKRVGGNTVYQSHDCIDDYTEFASSKFGKAPYIVVENYRNGSNCGTKDGVTVYLADGLCHPSASDGTSFKIQASFGGSVTFTTYPTASCNDSEADYYTVGSKYINTQVCYEGTWRLYADMTTLPAFATATPTPTTQTPTPTTQTPATTTQAPTEAPTTGSDYNSRVRIMFPAWLWEPSGPRAFISG